MEEEHAGELTPKSELQALLALQDHDLDVDQHRYRRAHLPERASITAIDAELALLQRGRDVTASERQQFTARFDVLEHETNELTSRIAAIDARLSSAQAGSFRDQESMAKEMGSLSDRRRELEDDELELMETLEPLDVRLAELDSETAALLENRATQMSSLEQAERAIDAELKELDASRVALVEAVPPSLLSDYERLRAHLGGIGAARIVRNQCSGCNLALSASELDRVRHDDSSTVFHCEQCGRILVP